MTLRWHGSEEVALHVLRKYLFPAICKTSDHLGCNIQDLTSIYTSGAVGLDANRDLLAKRNVWSLV